MFGPGVKLRQTLAIMFETPNELKEHRTMEKTKYLGNGAFEVDMTKDTVTMTNPVTPQQVRDIILSCMISSGPGLDQQAMPTQNELENLLDMATNAINAGRLIDFGFWPNEQIKQVGARSGKLYTQGALGHPFSEPYLILHTWSDAVLHAKFSDTPEKEVSCLYLVNPFPVTGETCISFEAVSFEVMILHGMKTLCVGDRVLFHGEQSKGSDLFFCDVIPFAWRWLSDPDMMAGLATQLEPGASFERMAAANVLDPVAMGLMILNTRGIRQETISPNPKLNRARLKAGKPALPSFRRVDSASYITALQARLDRGKRDSQGGTHASPQTHIRMGHWRRLDEAGTKRTFIQDTLVNATEEMRATFKTNRSHYRAKQ